ncbi:MAG: M3 family oligoendopeptidase [Candidatus Magasanikbacteria bacterium]|jgi:oligoendopeptidase F|nr:M3 family oligoendopeptidase [Candidatus Magasanikbacteria bacterium]
MSTWNISKHFDFDTQEKIDAAIALLQETTAAFVSEWKENTEYLSNPEVLAEALKQYEVWVRACGHGGGVGYYAWLKLQLNSENQENKALSAKLSEMSTNLYNQIQFFTLKIAKIEPSVQETMLAHTALQEYKHFLARLFAQAKHQLSEKEEKILNLKSTSAYERWVQLVEQQLSAKSAPIMTEDGTEKETSFNEILGLRGSRNKAIRDSAAKQVHRLLAEYAPIAEAEINAVFHDKKVDDTLRGFDRPDSDRHLNDDIETEVVDAMRKAVSGKFDVSARFYKLKAKLNGAPTMKYHERAVPYGNIEDNYSFEDAVVLVKGVFEKLDPSFADIFQRFLDNGQIDVFPQKGKSGGAFCVYWTPEQPVFVLLNHAKTLGDVLTLAHEMGHAINDEYIRDKQHALHFETSTATAEVASTFMEDFVLAKLLETADDEQRLAILMKRLDDDVAAIMRQVACYNFEEALHKAVRGQGYVSKESIGKLFNEHMHAYMGDAVEQCDGAENWWVYWSHIRRFFYVYSYASGLLISKAMQNMVREDATNIEKVKTFLQTGVSKSPKETFAAMGIDIADAAFWQEGLKGIEQTLVQAEELAKKLGKV